MEHFIQYSCPSDFWSQQSEGFVYVSKNPKSNKVMYFIKGLYGYFTPDDSTSFTNLLLEKILDTHHIIIGNSSRRYISASHEAEAFEGKSLQAEIYDANEIFREGLVQLENNYQVQNIHIWGHSFGGTLAIQLPRILDSRVKSITVMNSPSGASSKTKPLLKDLATQSEQDTFNYLTQFTGTFNLIQGGVDTVVPLESGYKIFTKAESAHQKNHFILKDMDHRGLLSDKDSYAIYDIMKILEFNEALL